MKKDSLSFAAVWGETLLNSCHQMSFDKISDKKHPWFLRLTQVFKRIDGISLRFIPFFQILVFPLFVIHVATNKQHIFQFFLFTGESKNSHLYLKKSFFRV